MAKVCVRGPLRKLTEDRAEHELPGGTVLEVLRALELGHPSISGWILDERGEIRRHLHVFVDGEMATEMTPVGPGARVDVLTAITGG